jgi:ATP/ADP translocase
MFERAHLGAPPSALTAAVWRLGRGGAAAAGAILLTPDPSATNTTTLGDTLRTAGGGWGSGPPTAFDVNDNDDEPMVDFMGFSMAPQGKAVLWMAIAMACHYFGYSLARPITVALFTSHATGYAGMPAAFPLAMAFVSPFSLLLLMGYGNVLQAVGPAGALLQSTLFCSLVLAVSAVAMAVCQSTHVRLAGIPVVKLLSGPLFVFRESYVQLLTSQFWSFMASALTPTQSAQWFGPIAGLTSIASAIAGLAVSPLVERIGLAGVLFLTAVTLLGSLLGARQAYDISDQYGFTPVDGHKQLFDKDNGNGTGQQRRQSSNNGLFALFVKASQIFQRVPVLGALFLEILASQGLATVLNVCFVSRLESAIPHDGERAGWVGVFFALINIITMTLQFGCLPYVMKVVEPRDLWRVIPLVSVFFTSFQALQANPSLAMVSASLLVMKVSEYSARRALDEMVFVPLDFESRFVGKEVIGVFGYRFGKSLMSLALSALTALLPTFALKELSVLSSLVSLGWMRTAWRLSNFVPTRAQAEEGYQQVKQQERKKES